MISEENLNESEGYSPDREYPFAHERWIPMGRYNICVYAISKNEEKHVKLWMESMREADRVVVLDTGSDDQTVSLLRKLGAEVTVEKINPWRFDTARNRSLELVPEDTDICVCVDLDERFEPGWREKLEAAWQPETVRARYRYTWSFNPDGSEGCVFWIDKIHARKGFRWEHPVHEVLVYTENRPCLIMDADGIQLNHYPDPKKSRAQYLPLLELAVKEKPDDDRNMHYLGREYMYRGEWDKCISTLLRHLSMPQAVWKDERCASMRFLARAYLEKGDFEQARGWYHKSIAEAPYLREPYMDFAMMLYQQQDWYGVLYLTECALRIVERPRSYICEAASWGSLPYDLASLGYYYTGNYPKALEMVNKALEFTPDDPRLLANQELMQQACR